MLTLVFYVNHLSFASNFSNFTQKKMSKVLAFAGSNSSQSINFSLLQSILQNIPTEKVEIVNLSSIELPVYSIDIEKNEGFPPAISHLYKHIQNSRALVIAVNEHNGAISAFFKNILDWLSRVDVKFLANKNILLLSTSPGGRGAISALEQAENMLTRMGGKVVVTFSLPSFSSNFTIENLSITNESLELEASNAVSEFMSTLAS